jgi:uncharacterized membrane protein
MWTAVLVGCAACYLLKVSGFVVPHRLLEDPRVVRAAAVLPVALLAGLIAVQTFATGRALAVDVRVAGLAAAIAAAWLRAPFLVVVVAGAATTAALRAIG